jgi:hypothetical protein
MDSRNRRYFPTYAAINVRLSQHLSYHFILADCPIISVLRIHYSRSYRIQPRSVLDTATASPFKFMHRSPWESHANVYEGPLALQPHRQRATTTRIRGGHRKSVPPGALLKNGSLSLGKAAIITSAFTETNTDCYCLIYRRSQ